MNSFGDRTAKTFLMYKGIQISTIESIPTNEGNVKAGLRFGCRIDGKMMYFRTLRSIRKYIDKTVSQ